MSTTVKNPMIRGGQLRYFKNCSMCGELFTSLGISRHWNKCKKKMPEYIARQAQGNKEGKL